MSNKERLGSERLEYKGRSWKETKELNNRPKKEKEKLVLGSYPGIGGEWGG